MTSQSTPTYQVLALRYATTAPGRERRENFMTGLDLHDGPMPLDYFVWAIVGNGRTIVVDTGFGAEMAQKRKRILLRDPTEALRSVGIDAAAVSDVILTHLHYDHAGRLDAFPRATFHLQDAEMCYATGRFVCHEILRTPFEVDDVVDAVRLVYGGRVRFHRGTSEVAPGISLHLVGGHSGGLQAVRVSTARGPLVLASDSFHFNENRCRKAPFPLVFDVGAMLEGFRLCGELAGGDETLLIPGHDPEVLKLWPPYDPAVPDVVRVDLSPLGKWSVQSQEG
jgi:glyoxylase-like metal-dependent hydrolase (beta-lactamase superfamily II)